MDFPLSAWRCAAELGLCEPNAAVASNRRNYQPEFGLGSRRVPPRRWRWRFLTAVRLEVPRSEEHTSELQSLTNLVCRLLLEKKNTMSTTAPLYPNIPSARSTSRAHLTT